jgi:uncharacterized protein YlzI (FlbEa/FlbD family)
MIIKLTTMDGRPRYVNVDLIQYFEQRFMDKSEVEGTVLVFREPDTTIVVSENAEYIFNLLESEPEPAEDENDGNET